MILYIQIMALDTAARAELLGRCDIINDRELHTLYDEMIDDYHAPVEIAGHIYSASYALKNVDPTAYRCGFLDWLSDDDFLEIEGEYYNTEELQTEYHKMMEGE